MPYPGYVNVGMTTEARKFLDMLIVKLTTKHQRRFNISDAIIQAADDLEDELSKDSGGK